MDIQNYKERFQRDAIAFLDKKHFFFITEQIKSMVMFSRYAFIEAFM